MFSCEFGEISRNTFFTEHLRETASVHKYAEKRYGFNSDVHKAIKVSCLLGSKIPITYKHNLEAAVRRYSWKEMFIKISQDDTQKSNCLGIS